MKAGSLNYSIFLSPAWYSLELEKLNRKKKNWNLLQNSKNLFAVKQKLNWVLLRFTSIILINSQRVIVKPLKKKIIITIKRKKKIAKFWRLSHFWWQPSKTMASRLIRRSIFTNLLIRGELKNRAKKKLPK